jgi:hypothetical protein
LRQTFTNRNLGGADRDRTGDPLVANQVLSQLSYSPTHGILVGLGRVELPTSPLSGVRSSQLSYRPGFPCRNSSAPAPQISNHDLKRFEDKVEHAGKLRLP